jgi:hypothetical protein
VSDGRVLAITGAVCFVLGGIALAYAVSLDLTAHEFKSAAVCNPGIEDANCLRRRAIQITDIGTGRYGEVDIVDFLDDGNPHESHLGFGRYDTSVLKPGASGTATLWHGQYTNLDIAGIDFLTDQNPVAGQAVWILFGVIGIGFALVLWAAALAWNVMNRRRDDAPQ